MPLGFAPPDFVARIDPLDFARQTPLSATIRGAFLADLLSLARAAGRELTCDNADKKYHAFKDYPLVEHVRLLPEVARAVHPSVTLGEGLRRIGQRMYPMFASSLVGKVIFSTVGHNPSTVLRAGVKAYNVSSSVGHVDILEIDDHHGHFHLQDIYNFVEQYHVGIFEGAIRVIGFEPTVLTKPASRTSSEFYVTW